MGGIYGNMPMKGLFIGLALSLSDLQSFKHHYHLSQGTIWSDHLFWPRGFADDRLGTAYLLLLLFLKTASRAACPRNEWNSKRVHEIGGIQGESTKLVEFKACPRNLWTSLQCVHEIGGIHKVSKNWWNFYRTALCCICIAFNLTFKKSL